jgi:ABC-type nitrate/sulfonate/bicarbonate transport system substrate-binding protein
MIKRWIVVLSLLSQWVIPCASRGASAPTKLIIAHDANNPRVAPLWVTDEQGFFAKYGIKAEVIFIRNSAISISALYAKNIDVSQAGGISVLGVADKSSELKIIAAFNSKLTHDLVVRPGINSPKDLRGKRLGVQVIGGSLWISAMLALEHLKIDAARDDIRTLTIGDQIVLTQALETGVIDIAPLDGAFSQRLKKKGFPVLVELQKTNIRTVSSTVVVLNALLQSQPTLMENLLKALIEGAAFTLAPENKALVIRTIMKRLKITDPADAEEGYEGLIKATDLKPYPSMEGMRNMQRFMKTQNPQVANINLESLIDTRFVKKLDDNGFIDQTLKSYRVGK